MTACIAFAADGTLVAGMESGIFALHLGTDGNVWRLADPLGGGNNWTSGQVA